MTSGFIKKSSCLLLALGVSIGAVAARAEGFPDPIQDEAPAENAAPRTIVFAGGCFWGVQAVFQHVKGVEKAISGYTGGDESTANYGAVSDGNSGHAESVEVTYNPQVVSLGQLLKVFFFAAHNPTELNRQGPDTGTQYRSAIFFTSAEQEKIATAYIAQIEEGKFLSSPIMTKVQALEKFYPAESYHQDYARKHPDQPYIAMHDKPKVEGLKKNFSGLYQDQE